MKAYAWVDAKTSSSNIVKILSEEGFLLDCFEPRMTLTKLKDKIGMFAKDYEVEWLDRPWSNDDYKRAVQAYELNYDIRMDCREY